MPFLTARKLNSGYKDVVERNPLILEANKASIELKTNNVSDIVSIIILIEKLKEMKNKKLNALAKELELAKREYASQIWPDPNQYW